MGVFNSLFGSKEPQKEKVSYLKMDTIVLFRAARYNKETI